MTIEIVFLKSEFCRFESAYKDLKVRIKISGVYDAMEDNEFTAKIISKLGMEYPLTDWTEVITDTTTKLVKEYDLNNVVFDLGDSCDIDLPLNIGKHTLSVTINGTTATGEFEVVPLTVDSIKKQYLLGVDLESKTELVFKQELRKITGVELLEISKETPVGPKEIHWNPTDSTLQWDFGEPVVISEDYTDYILTNHMSAIGVTDGDYIKVRIEDITALPVEEQYETAIVDVSDYSNEEFRYWVKTGYNTLVQTVIMTDLEPTLYSSDKSLVSQGYKYFDPVMNTPKRFSQTSNISFEFPVNMLQCIVELWAQYRGLGADATRVDIGLERVDFSMDGQVVIRGFPYDSVYGSNTATIGWAGTWDRNIYSENHHGARNKVKNFWNGTLVVGIIDEDLRQLALDVMGRIAAISLLLQAGLGKGAGISSRSFSVGGISSSYSTTESAENSLYSGVITDLQRTLGVGKATKDEMKYGLVNMLKQKIEGGSMAYKL
jgi:hypothetical protein